MRPASFLTAPCMTIGEPEKLLPLLGLAASPSNVVLFPTRRRRSSKPEGEKREAVSGHLVIGALARPRAMWLNFLTELKIEFSESMRTIKIKNHLRSIRIDQAARYGCRFRFPIGPEDGRIVAYDPPPRGLRVPCPLCKPFDREERRNSCRYRARPLCPQGLPSRPILSKRS